jgi:adenylate cyclase
MAERSALAIARFTAVRGAASSGSGLLAAMVAVLLVGLPFATWLDLRSLSENALTLQASDLNSVITSVTGFYSSDVVGRLNPEGTTVASDRYRSVHGAIPIPATFSLALGHIVGAHQSNIGYRFVSDFPFKGRPAHHLDDFEREALAALRENPHQVIKQVTWTGLNDRVRLVAPVIMQQTCVACHNSDPDSPKRDWKVGDVRGIQELSIIEPVASNLFSLKYLLLYFVFASILGVGFMTVQRRQAAVIREFNRELTNANDTLRSVATRVSRYLSPQIYESIFSGKTADTIHTKRKKLTIFFSDIKDFTSTSQRLQPEALTALLNEYFTEMSHIALEYGGTVDKFVGDAILIFFGDPESKGVEQDAQAALRMAIEMQSRLQELNTKWCREGLEQPLRVRMGINSGFCDVGNFGSSQRMDYTVIGAEANLASRLSSFAEPGSIVVSYETYALVREIALAHALPPVPVKGISREVIPYVIDGLIESTNEREKVFTAHVAGLDLYLDPEKIAEDESARLEAMLRDAAEALRSRTRGRGVTDDENGSC